MSEKKKRIKQILVIAALLFILLLGFLIVKFAMNVSMWEYWLSSHMVIGSVVYVVMVAVQVVLALVPGGPMEVAGGYVFGVTGGTLLFALGATLGGCLVFLLVRRYGMRIVELFFEHDKIEKLTFLNGEEKRDMIFMILFVIPGSPKDLFCYFAGLTNMRLTMFLFINVVGRLPALIASVATGSQIGSSNYLQAVIIFLITAIVSGIGILLYYRILKWKNRDMEG